MVHLFLFFILNTKKSFSRKNLFLHFLDRKDAVTSSMNVFCHTREASKKGAQMIFKKWTWIRSTKHVLKEFLNLRNLWKKNLQKKCFWLRVAARNTHFYGCVGTVGHVSINNAKLHKNSPNVLLSSFWTYFSFFFLRLRLVRRRRLRATIDFVDEFNKK